ncbi:MAG: cation:proton antiporter, partial [Thiohalophilus sp.]
MHEALALMPAIILLLAGILSITIARRIGLSPIVGYLIAGLLIGPHALNLIQESKTTHLLAELGVVFLLFDIGLHFSLSTIWDARRDI